MSGPTELNLNSTTPAAPSGKQNIIFQADAAYTDPITGLPLRDGTGYPQPATSSLEGTIMLAGDIGGTADVPKVVGIQGVGVSAASPTNGQVLQYNSGSGLYVPASVSGAGGASGPTPEARRWAYAGIASAAPSGIGTVVGDAQFTFASAGGSVSGASSPFASPSFPAPVVAYSTGTANPSFAGLNGFPIWGTGQNLLFVCKVAISRLTNVRMRHGLGDVGSGSTWIGSDTLPSNNYVAFRFSTNASDTTFHCEAGNGSAVTVVDSGITVVANTLYTLQVKINDSVPNAVFSINGSVVATITTDLPSASVPLRFWNGIDSLTTSSASFYLVWNYMEADN